MKVTTISNRRGSALLIVIGLLSFFIVSSVSFAIFMRQGRAPSSYLRRISNARYLLKAGLANAIARIDEGVGNDAYPGVRQDPANKADIWYNRVFCPGGALGIDDTMDTVSTLTLEGLAYLPPAIINEVRLVSRFTSTAVWRKLSYDSGRYAFCAVDVSDCFDINKLCAEERRLSVSGERLNLSSLFPDTAGDLETILEKCSLHCKPDSANIPFVSVADFNIVAGAAGSPFAPFYNYIGTAGTTIYRNDTDGKNCISNALFITDTWFPPSDSATTTTQQGGTSTKVRRIDLEKEDGTTQPFRTFEDNANLLSAAKSPTELNKILLKNIGGVGMGCLYDYLDKDNRPISFSIPTVETAPMVCGIGLAHNSKFAPKAEAGGSITSAEIKKGEEIFKYVSKRISLTKMMDTMMLSGVAAFPFKRASAKKNFKGSYTGEALVRIFFGPETIKSRLSADSPLYPSKGADDWKTGFDSGVMTIKCPISGLSFSGDIKKTTDAVKQFTATLEAPAGVNAPMFHYVEEFKVEKDDDGNVTETKTRNYFSLDGIKDNKNALVPRDADGEVAGWWKNAKPDPAEPTAGGAKAPTEVTLGTDKYVPHVLVWVRLMDGGKTVDIVPARLKDDELWGVAFDAQGEGDKFGVGTPVLEFRGDATRAFTYSYNPDPAGNESIEKKLNGTPETFPSWTQLYAVDPRYNFAPENWFAMTGNGDAKPDEWLKAIGADGETASGIIGKDGRDNDIFMFTSDQEVLQSIGELAFLPAVQAMDGTGDFFDNDFLDSHQGFNGNDFTKRLCNGGVLTSTGQFASDKFMWRTYSAIPRTSDTDYDPIYALKNGSETVEVVAGLGAFRVNPFSPDKRILMAALKDTPFDYTVASDNEEQNKTVACEVEDRADYAFCAESTLAKLDNDELDDLAGEMHANFASWAQRSSLDRFDCTAAMRNMAWDDADNRCNDGQLSLFDSDDLQVPLHGVDRKYLFSFWRECFQNRQQLFLVFIRAEPLTVGGMGEGSLAAAQLGARGVALVWRDPLPAAQTDAPHRTRVLFYHQFD